MLVPNIMAVCAASNVCGFTEPDICVVKGRWAVESQYSIECVKEIASIREPVSPERFIPAVKFDYPRSVKCVGEHEVGACSRIVPPVGVPSLRAAKTHTFWSFDATRVYGIAPYKNRIDLLYGGLTMMKLPNYTTTCLTFACAELKISALVADYADVPFGDDTWRHNQTWAVPSEQSEAYTTFVADRRTGMYDRAQRKAADTFKARIATMPAPGQVHKLRYETLTRTGVYETRLVVIRRSDYVVSHEWLHPHGGRMLYVMDLALGSVSSSLYIDPPVNEAALVQTLFK